MSEKNISYDLKRFAGIKRDYTSKEVERLRGSIKIEYSMCKHQSKKLWDLLNSEPYINTLGSLSGNHAVQHAKAGLKAFERMQRSANSSAFAAEGDKIKPVDKPIKASLNILDKYKISKSSDATTREILF